MQFNPYTVQAVPIGSNQSAIATLTGQMNQALGGLGQAISETGRGIRSSKVADLIGSGALQGLSEVEARAKIAQLTQGDVGKQTQTAIADLLGGKRSAESASKLAKAKALENKQRNALTRLGINTTADTARFGIQSREGIAERRIKSREQLSKNQIAANKANTIELGLQKSSNRALNEIAKKEQAKKAQQYALEQIALKASLAPEKKSDIKDIAKDVKELGGVDKMVDDAQDEITNDQWFMERDYSDKSKTEIRGAVKSSLLNNKYLADRFRIDPAGFTKLVIEQLGKTDESYMPWNKDEWIPYITKERVADLEKKLKAMKGK